MRLAVIGHVEWSELVSVERLPVAGEILHLDRSDQMAAGGGAVAAVQLARLAGGALFFTAVGDDEPGRAVAPDLEPRGLDVRAATRPDPQRRGFVFLQPGERTIVTIGDKLVPVGRDPLGWEDLDGIDGVFFVAGDAAALHAARRARVLVATSRVMPLLREAGVHLDAVVGSGHDPAERYQPLPDPPGLVVVTEGAQGGAWTAAEGRTGTYQAVNAPGPIADSYGCGDSFAAGVTFGLAAGMAPEQALELGARCGATCLTGHGPYERQLGREDLET